jgi:hypothetical protein
LYLLYEFKAWPFTLREEHSLRVLENRALRKIFGPKREKVAGGGLEEIYNIFFLCVDM